MASNIRVYLIGVHADHRTNCACYYCQNPYGKMTDDERKTVRLDSSAGTICKNCDQTRGSHSATNWWCSGIRHTWRITWFEFDKVKDDPPVDDDISF